MLVCSPVIPEFDRESGAKRIWDFIQLFREEGCQVGLLTESTRAERRYVEELRGRQIEIFQGLERAPEALQRQQPDLALVCFWRLAQHLLPRLREQRPSIRVVVDSIDLHFLREFRGAFRGPTGMVDPEHCFDLMREVNAYAAADRVWTVSHKEKDLLNDLVGDCRLACCVPDCEELSVSPLPFARRQGMVFVGNFRHPPNRAAVQWLCRDILPRVDRRLLDAHPVSVVGHGLTDEVARYGQDRPYVKMVGWMPSLEPVLHSSRLSLVPLTFGAGTKRKLIQSLMCGTPAVSTSIGIEGLGLAPGRHVLSADEPQSFADSIELLLSDASLWKKLAKEGRRRVLRSHSREAVRECFRQAVADALGATAKPARLAQRAFDLQRHWLQPQYEQLVARLRLAVQESTPAGSRLLVVSRGDEEMLVLKDRTAQHFPSDSSGNYLGHHPPDSRWCIAELEACRRQGFSHFVLPAAYSWWMEHYRGLQEHLVKRCHLVLERQDTGAIYALEARPNPEPDDGQEKAKYSGS